jgi:hypothetical protein
VDISSDFTVSNFGRHVTIQTTIHPYTPEAAFLIILTTVNVIIIIIMKIITPGYSFILAIILLK